MELDLGTWMSFEGKEKERGGTEMCRPLGNAHMCLQRSIHCMHGIYTKARPSTQQKQRWGNGVYIIRRESHHSCIQLVHSEGVFGFLLLLKRRNRGKRKMDTVVSFCPLSK